MLERLLLRALRLIPAAAVDRIRRLPLVAPAAHRLLTLAFRPITGRTLEVPVGPGRGLRLSVDAASLVWLGGRVELPVQHALTSLLRTGDVAYDVGANVGYYTLLAARAVGEEGCVVAFEPHPENLSALRRNLAANQFSNVVIVAAAVSSAAGRGRLSTGNRALASLGAADGVEVETVTLDAFVAANAALRPTMVKIDVEGHELEVLAGFQRGLRTIGPAVLCELHDTANAVTQALMAAGYDLEPLGGERLESAPHTLARPRLVS